MKSQVSCVSLLVYSPLFILLLLLLLLPLLLSLSLLCKLTDHAIQ